MGTDRETTVEGTLIKLDPADVSVLMGFDADLRGDLREFPGWPRQGVEWVEEPDRSKWERYAQRTWWVENWKSETDSFVWTVDAPAAADYNVYMVGTGQQTQVEVSSIEDTVTGWVNNGLDVQWDIHQYPPQQEAAQWRWEFDPPRDCFRLVWSGWDRIPIGSLRIPAGVSQITIRATKPGPELGLYSLELVRSDAEATLAAKARQLRSDTTWFADAKYGLFFHWCSSAYPRHGERKPFPKAVDDFDVDAFVEMIRETGVGYIIFVTTWAEHTFPAPIAAIDDVLPGRTSKRDLIMELADGLAKHGVKLLLYYHCGPSDPEWWEKAKPNFFDNWCAIMTEVGQRYGEKVMGYWFDCGGTYYEMNAPFERLARAAKAGNPDRIISWNTGNFFPKYSDFQDYAPGEGPHLCNDHSLLRHIPKGGSGVFLGGRHAGLQSHVCFGLEAWVHDKPDSPIPPPFWDAEALTAWIEEAATRRCPLSIGIEVYEDGTPDPDTLELLKTVRRNVHGTGC